MAEQARIITAVCSALYEVDIFDRLRPGLKARGWTLVIVTHLFSIWVRSRRLGIGCTLARSTQRTPCPPIETARTPEQVLGLVSATMAARFRHSLWDALERSARLHPPAVLIQWGGLGLVGQVATAFASANGVKTLFIELGNIEPKLFVDREGVNAASEIARRPELLDAYAVTEEEIEAWKAQLVARRRAMTTIPQARRLVSLNPWYVVDIAARLLTRAPYPRQTSIISKVADKFRLLFRKPPPPAVWPDRPYLLLPLQVSNDTNLLIFAEHDNLSALGVAERLAQEKNLLLVVKPHPAELDMRLLAAIKRTCRERGHLLTSYNVTDLILGAAAIVTINSSVGLEAKLLGVPVTVLGRSLYGAMTPRQIAALAMRRLMNFSPFARNEVTGYALDQMFAVLDGGDGKLRP